MANEFWNKSVERRVRRFTGASRTTDVEELQPVWGGNGMLFRVEIEGADVESVIVKHIVPQAHAKRRVKPSDASTKRTLASYDNELTFYSSYGNELVSVVRLPHFYGGERSSDGWLFVLEDLAASGFSMAKKTYDDSDIRGALRWLARFHAAFLSHPGSGSWKAGSYWNWSDRKDDHSRMQHPELRQAAAKLDAQLNQCRHKTLIHGDAKTDNFCFGDSDSEGASDATRVAGLDFQYVGQGTGMKDVMCLLDSCHGVTDAAAAFSDQLDYYFAQLRQGLATRPSVDVAAVEAEWRALYALAWADYYRFLDGWAPGRYAPEGYAAEMVSVALAQLDGI